MDKSILILDLDGTLVYRNKLRFRKRPYLNEFLKFAKTYFEIIIWTSGTHKNTKKIMSELAPGCIHLHREYCKPYPTDAEPWAVKKDISYIRRRFKHLENRDIIIVDDTERKIILDDNSKYLHIPCFKGGDDSYLLDIEMDLIQYLLEKMLIDK